ncbi:MAG: hypothetical protein QXQ02_00085 [Halobacteria archaeon]
MTNRLVQKLCRQYAVVRNYLNADKFGQAVFGGRYEIKVRWNKIRREVVSDNGSVVVLTDEIHTYLDIPVGSIIRLGRLSDADNDLVEIVTRKVVPDIKSRQYVYVYGARRWSNKVPA